METYKFPDEVEKTELVDDIQIEIVDDTPKADQGREPLPQELVAELEKDDLEEYSDKVKKRLGQMKKVWHDERRAKELASREKDEALRFAHGYIEENKQLKQRLGAGEKQFMAAVTKTANGEVLTAKEQLKQAYEAGDAEKIADAQEALTDAKLKLRDYQRYKPALQAPETSVQPVNQAQVPRQVVDSKAETWKAQNTWWGVDEEMTSLALGLHEKLVRSGADPHSDDYYRRIDEGVRKRFPENFEGGQPQEQEKPVQRRAANVVAPATRSTAPRQVKLSPTQINLARKFNLTNEAYAREVIRLENNNG
jgi:hypothetical protein